ncbi:MAG TPA: RidA family protein [Gemmatimonadetes bacterium]|jgi:2-iminobutanoate/2-iminopropanoate deaminase|nr:RidA family protein [Gemmatimonadota bacterium]
MTILKSISTDKAPGAAGPYSQGIRLGDLIFVSGQIPIDPLTGKMVDGDIGEQTARVLQNVSAVLEAAGSSLDCVVKTTVYLADLGSFGEMNKIYAKSFGEHRPTRATVEVGLPAGVAIEIDAIAVPE